MAVWGVSMFKDEDDIAYHTLMHMAEEHLDGLIVADNLSTDDTRAELERAKQDLAGTCEVVIVEDREAAHYQGRKMTGLAGVAHGHGAEWIVPFDADELWYSREGPLGDVLETLAPDVWVASAQVWNHFTTDLDKTEGRVTFESMVYRYPSPSDLPKVAVRWAPDMRIAMGNHGATFGAASRPDLPGRLELRHFPYRSVEQFVRKVLNGASAVDATDLPESECCHWREYGAIYDRSGEPALRSVYHTQMHFPEPISAGLVLDPAPFRHWSR